MNPKPSLASDCRDAEDSPSSIPVEIIESIPGRREPQLLLYGLIGPFAAGFINRYGPRRVMLMAFVLVAAGVSLTTLMNSPVQLVLLWGALVGCGTGRTAIVLGAAVVHRWFYSHRGLVIGLLTASTATGQLLFLPLLAHLV